MDAQIVAPNETLAILAKRHERKSPTQGSIWSTAAATCRAATRRYLGWKASYRRRTIFALRKMRGCGLLYSSPNGRCARFAKTVAVRICFAVFLSCLLNTLGAHAQIINVTDQTSTPIPGVGHDYIHALNETVNPANGSVNVTIPIPVPASRGFTLPFSVTYNSGGVYAFSSLDGEGDVTYMDLGTPPRTSEGGWRYSAPTLSYVGGSVQVAGNPPFYCYGLQDFVFTSPFGDSHPLGIAFWPLVGEGCPSQDPSPGHLEGDILSGGDSQYHAAMNLVSYSWGYGFGNLYVYDAHGTTYVFSTPMSTSSGFEVASYAEDRNGNIITYTVPNPSYLTAVTVTDTSGRVAISASGLDTTGDSGDTIAASGLATPFTLTWTSLTPSFTPPFSVWPGTETYYCNYIPGYQHFDAIQKITLPNGQFYQFDYDTTYGLLKQITYPDGGYVKYDWGLPSSNNNSNSSDNSMYTEYGYWLAGKWIPDPNNPMNNILVSSSQIVSGGVFCKAYYEPPAILHRYVSFDGATIAQQQDFVYGPVQWSSNGYWNQKVTNVTTTDKVRNKSFTTQYTYGYVVSPQQPEFTWTSYLFAPQIPVESSVAYYDFGASESPLETKSETWLDQYLQASEQITWGSSGPTSKIANTYSLSNPKQLIERDEYDYNSSTTPARKTGFTYQLFSSFGSILDKPCKQVVTDGGGNWIAETDNYFDGGTTLCAADTGGSTTANVSNLPTGTHDEANFASSSSSSMPRGNLTKQVRPLSSGGGGPATTYTYDKTGQVLSKTDPCGNNTCSDMRGSNFTTQYFYADNPPGSVNTNAYLTKIQYPTPPDGVAQVKTFAYNYGTGFLTQSKDENGQNTGLITTYEYNSPPSDCGNSDGLNRLSEVDFPDGGKATYCYHDGIYSVGSLIPSVTTSTLLKSPGVSKTSVAAMDGLSHVIHTKLTSDLGGADSVTTTYDGEGRVYTVTNPYRGSSPPAGSTITYSYDSLGRMILETEQDGSNQQWCYDGLANWLSTANCSALVSSSATPGSVTGTWVDYTDENLNHWQRAYDGFSRLTLVVEPNGTSQSPTMPTVYNYDILNNLLSVSQSGTSGSTPRMRSFTYDSLSRLISSSNPETGTVGYTYDANSNLLSKTSPATNVPSGTQPIVYTTIGYTYDPLNRLVEKTYTNDSSNTPTSCFQYDATAISGASPSGNFVGRLTNSWTQQAGTTCTGAPGSGSYRTLKSILAYDPLGRPTAGLQCTPSNCTTTNSYSLNYGYDLAGNLTSLTNAAVTVPGGFPLNLTYSYDSAGRMYNLTSNWQDSTHPNPLFNASSFWPHGPWQNAAYGNGLSLVRTYDSHLRITGENDTSSSSPGTAGTATITISGAENSR